MKLTKSAQELISRYLLGVRRALTGKKREDITAEIESSLLDRMEERFSDEKEITEAQVKDVLQDMGSPRKQASLYGSQRSLIGPYLYPVFLMVLRIVVLAVTGALTLVTLISAFSGEEIINAVFVLKSLNTIWNGVFMSAASVTLIFAIIERCNGENQIKEIDEFEKFDVNDLPELSDNEKQPGIAGIIFEMVVGIIGLVIFTLILGNGGQFPIIGGQPGGSLGQLRIFSDSFMRFVPAMMVIAGLDITRNAIRLAQGRQSRLTNWWNIAVEGARAVFIALLLSSFPLIIVEGLRSFEFAADWDLVKGAMGLNSAVRIFLIFALVGAGFEFLRGIYREIRKPSKAK